MIEIELSPEVESQLTRRAATQGLALPAYLQKIIEDSADNAHSDLIPIPPGSKTPAEAGRDLRELSRGLTLGGIEIKDLINEGRKY